MLWRSHSRQTCSTARPVSERLTRRSLTGQQRPYSDVADTSRSMALPISARSSLSEGSPSRQSTGPARRDNFLAASRSFYFGGEGIADEW